MKPCVSPPEFPAVTASAQHFAGVLALARGEIEIAHTRFDAALQALQRVPDDAPPFFIAMSLGWAVDERRDPPLPFAEETVLFGRRVGCSTGGRVLRLALALGERLDGHIDAAFTLIDDACARFNEIADRYGEAYALSQRGHVLALDSAVRGGGPCLLHRNRCGETCATSGLGHVTLGPSVDCGVCRRGESGSSPRA